MTLWEKIKIYVDIRINNKSINENKFLLAERYYKESDLKNLQFCLKKFRQIFTVHLLKINPKLQQLKIIVAHYLKIYAVPDETLICENQ